MVCAHDLLLFEVANLAAVQQTIKWADKKAQVNRLRARVIAWKKDKFCRGTTRRTTCALSYLWNVSMWLE